MSLEQDLRAEIDSLAGEIIHAYEELHLLYELSEGLTGSLTVAEVRSLILESLLHALSATSAELSLPSGTTRVAASSEAPAHHLTTTLRSAGDVLGSLELTRPSTAAPFSSADGKVLDAVGTLAANAIRNAQLYEELRQNEGHLRAVLDNVAEGIITVDHRDYIASFNPAAEEIFGFSAAEMLGHDVHLLLDPSQPGETTARRRTQETFPIELSVGEIRDKHLRVLGIRDISERKKAEAALEHQALHDTLTDLPNRVLLRSRLQAAIAEAQLRQTSTALLIMDLDRFKEVNDTFGHQYGDMLLEQLGQRLGTALGTDDTIARLGGDEFAVLLPRVSQTEAVAAAERLLKVLEGEFTVGGLQLQIDASIGIALSPEHGTDADSLLRRADVAMYVAKRGGTGPAVYSIEQDQHSPTRLAMVGELRHAIEHNELSLFYQPKVDYKTGLVTSVEALVRWEHPRHGLLSPDQFIPIAEQTGLIRPLARWVLEAALRESNHWYHEGIDISVAVNLSMRNLHDPEIGETIRELLARWGVPPIRLVIEITESSLMADAAHAMEVLTKLRSMGVGISIDDFGTGYSSLAYLNRLPVHELKIDRSFVTRMAVDENDALIVRSTIGLAHDLGLSVVAEGIEDEATWRMLEALGCDKAQGYFISRPVPAPELAAWLTAWNPRSKQSRAA